MSDPKVLPKASDGDAAAISQPISLISAVTLQLGVLNFRQYFSLTMLKYQQANEKSKVKLKKAVILGLGSMDLKNNKEYRSMQQLATFIEIIQTLRQLRMIEEEDVMFDVFLQEPFLTAIDVAVLKHFKIIVVPVPLATKQIGHNPLVYIPGHCIELMHKPSLFGRKPALFICSQSGSSHQLEHASTLDDAATRA